MFAFVTSLPHPANCSSYRDRSSMLRDTVASMLRQSEPCVRAVVVANEEPDCVMPSDPRLEIVVVDFEPAGSPIGKPTATWAIYEDKGAKLAVGTAAAVRAGACHVMYADSDDYVHRDLAAFASREPDASGWFFDSGYFHVHGSRTVTLVEHDFHQRNGTSHILRSDLLGVPADLDTGLTLDEVLDELGRDRVVAIMGRHKPIVEAFEALGAPLDRLPFPGAVAEVGTKENFSRVLAARGRREPVQGRIAEEFGVPVSGRLEALRCEIATSRARLARRIAQYGRGRSRRDDEV